MNRKQKIAIVIGAVLILVTAVPVALAALIHLSPRSAKVRAEAHVAAFDAVTRQYRAKRESLPPDLPALIESGILTGDDYAEGIPNDPWGSPYVYKILSDTEYRIFSRGADGLEGTEDDVVQSPLESAVGASHPARYDSDLDTGDRLFIALALMALTVTAVVVLKDRKPRA